MHDITSADLLKNAISAHREGDYFRAEDFYRQVINLSPDDSQDNFEALHYLSLIFIATDQPEISIPLLKKAISIKADNPDISYNLGLAYQKSEDIDSAIHYYKLAIALNPDFALAYNNLGVAYQHLGDLEEANFNLEKAFTIAPDCTEAYYNFSQSHKFSTLDYVYIDKITYQLESILENKKNSGVEKVNEEIKLNFALGKIYDDLSNYQTAFNYYSKANSLKNQGFDIQQFRNYVDQLINNYTPELVKKIYKRSEESHSSRISDSVVEHPKYRFTFIVGMPRSGTTLIEQVIASHPKVQSAGEIGFIGEIVDELPKLIHSSESYPGCIQSIELHDIKKISEAVHQQVHKFQTSFEVVTDKSPVNFLHIGLILFLFPDSEIIHCQRDPMDTGLSCFFQNFEKQHQYSYDLKTLALFHNEYMRLMKHWKALFPDKIYNITYEDMVEKQQEESKKLINACKLEWDEKCLSFYESNSVVNTASKWQVRRPIYKTSIKKWKHYERYIDDLRDNLETD